MIDDVCVNVSRRSDIYRNGRQVSLCSCSCPLFRWRVARYDRVAVSPRLPLPPVAVGGIIAMVMGQKAKEGAPLCVRKNRASARPGRLPFPTDNFEKK
jgi:hypothetical protein